MQVLWVINPNVYNIDRSGSFIAILLDDDDAIKACLTTVNRQTVESAVKHSGKGSVIAGRYFLRQNEIATTITLCKKKQVKKRCCSISWDLLDKQFLQAFDRGKSLFYIKLSGYYSIISHC